MCTPLLLTADTSPVMDIKCFFFVSLFWTYIRDRKPISQSINRAHAGARTHSYCIQPLTPVTAGYGEQPEDC